MRNYKRQLYLFLYVSLFIVISSFALLFINFTKQVKLQNEVLKIETSIGWADSLANNLLQAETDKRGYQLTGDAGFLKNYYATKRACRNNLENLKKNNVAETEAKIISTVDSLMKLRIANLDSGIVVFTTKGFAASVDFMQLKSKKNIREMLDEEVLSYKNYLSQQLKENTASNNKKSSDNLKGLIVLTLIFIILMLVATWTFRRAQKKVFKNKNKFEEAQKIAKIGSWEWNILTNKLTWSREQFRLFGEDRKTFDLTHESYLKHFSEEERNKTIALLKDVLEGKADYAVEHEIIRADGTVLTVFEQGTVSYDENNKPIGMFGTTQDITEQKRLEESFEREKYFLEALMDNMPDSIYFKDRESKLMRVSKYMADRFGTSVDSLIGKSDFDFQNEIHAKEAFEDEQNIQKTGNPKIDYIEKEINQDGTESWVLTTKMPLINLRREIVGTFGISRDITNRKLAEIALNNSEERYRQIVETAQEGIWMLDENNYTIFVNKKMCEMLEYSREEMMGKQNYYFKDEEGKIKATRDIERRKQGIAETQISKFIAKSGKIVWTSLSTNPVFNDEGKYAGALGMFTDITEQKKANEDLIIAQKKFQEIFDNTADGIYQSTTEGKFITANPSMAKIFGYDSPDDLIRSVADISTQIYADPAERKKMGELLSQKGHIKDFKFQGLTKKGDTIWVSENIHIIPGKNGDPYYFEGTLEDITERKKSEEQLLNLSNRLQLAVRASSIGIWDWNIVTNNIVWDEETYHIYDVSMTDTKSIFESFEAAIHPEDLDRVNKEIQMVLRGEKEYDIEYRVIWKDGTIHYVQTNALVQRDDAGKPLRVIGTNKDITERKKAEEEILQLNQSLDQFANITAHDLQEPIRMVSGFLGLLYKRYNNEIDEQGKTYIHRAKDGADRMSILITDLLEFSRSGNKAARKEPVDLGVVLDLVDRDLSIVMADTGTILRIPNSLPVVTGTQSALYRLFLNLISNGIKFRKKDAVPEITLTVNELTEFWEFTLQDNGIGIAEKDQPKLFKAFQRLHRREEYAGTGLGLVTCKKIVEIHGGRIWIISEEGKGTAFHFTIKKTG